ncbi:glycerol-3-phosphate responsive antiterminator [Listeria grandensis]|uniref:Glycerol uptake operon antiterminator regulatory protein n=1 Tax=Listeria grandensis TaxID=1494963 RepID=A0A7X0Y0W7_9LIST|nr:glycerol-3-phosphate responsive antiterminator [Listeria grandensis]MBC1473035.1 glycerol-3-phosphate responsive antiterminator [Listeria grandensis]MBC1934981.1 glycerol-3-phosphate responsive antiterminator [Listeria grandensis]
MPFNGQTIIPAAHNHRDVEKILKLDAEYMVMLETQVGQLKSLVQLAASGGKKVILHADLIHGLKNDEYAVDFLCQDVRPAGIISTRGNVILKAKQHKVLAIQRLFMLDSSAFTKGTALVQKVQPDYIELLPGILPTMVEKMTELLHIPVIAGGLITTQTQIDEILAANATAITTSQKSLWK